MKYKKIIGIKNNFCFNKCLTKQAFKKFNMDVMVKMERFQIKQNSLNLKSTLGSQEYIETINLCVV